MGAKLGQFVAEMDRRCLLLIPVVFFTFIMPALALDKCKEVRFSHEAESAGFWVG